VPAYRLPSPYDRPPLRRRASGLALALGVNLLLLLVLLTLGQLAPVAKEASRALIVDLLPESHSAAAQPRAARPLAQQHRPTPKPPPIILPVKPTIQPPPAPKQSQPWIEMSKDELAAAARCDPCGY
jgi:protein TonB